jgi:DNA-binding MarR family transcriptional regulator
MTTEETGQHTRDADTGPSLNPQVIGQAENALRALLERSLVGTGLAYRHWIALSIAVGNEVALDQDELVGRIAGVLRADTATAHEVLSDLRADEFVEMASRDGSRIRPTDAGRDLHRRVRTSIDEIVNRLFRDIPAEDLQTAARVLTLVTARADVELVSSL